MAPPVRSKIEYKNTNETLTIRPSNFWSREKDDNKPGCGKFFELFLDQSVQSDDFWTEVKKVTDVCSKMNYHMGRGGEGAALIAFMLGQRDSKGRPIFTFDEMMDPNVRREEKKELFKRFTAALDDPKMQKHLDEAFIYGTLEVQKEILKKTEEALKSTNGIGSLLNNPQYNLLLSAYMEIEETWTLTACENTRIRLKTLAWNRPDLQEPLTDILNNILKNLGKSKGYEAPPQHLLHSLATTNDNLVVLFHDFLGYSSFEPILNYLQRLSKVCVLQKPGEKTLSDKWINMDADVLKALPIDFYVANEIDAGWEDVDSYDVETTFSDIIENTPLQNNPKELDSYKSRVREKAQPLLKLIKESETDKLLRAGIYAMIGNGTFAAGSTIPLEYIGNQKTHITDIEKFDLKIPSKQELYRAAIFSGIKIPPIKEDIFTASIADTGKGITGGLFKCALSYLENLFPDENDKTRKKAERLLDEIEAEITKEPAGLTDLTKLRNIQKICDKNLPELNKIADEIYETNKKTDVSKSIPAKELLNRIKKELPRYLSAMLPFAEAGITELPPRDGAFNSENVIEDRSKMLDTLLQDFEKNKVTFPSQEWQLLEKSLERVKLANAEFERSLKDEKIEIDDSKAAALSSAMEDLQSAAEKYLKFKESQPVSEFDKSASRIFLAARVRSIAQFEVKELAPTVESARSKADKTPFSIPEMRTNADMLNSLIQSFESKGIQGSHTDAYTAMFTELDTLRKNLNKHVGEKKTVQFDEQKALLEQAKKAKEKVDAYLIHKQKDNNKSLRSVRRIQLAEETQRYLDNVLTTMQCAVEIQPMITAFSGNLTTKLQSKDEFSVFDKLIEYIKTDSDANPARQMYILSKEAVPKTKAEYDARYARCTDAVLPVLLASYLMGGEIKLVSEIGKEMVQAIKDGKSIPTYAKEIFENHKEKLPRFEYILHDVTADPQKFNLLMSRNLKMWVDLSDMLPFKPVKPNAYEEYVTKYDKIPENAASLLSSIKQDCTQLNLPKVFINEVEKSFEMLSKIRYDSAPKTSNEYHRRAAEYEKAMMPLLIYSYLKAYPNAPTAKNVKNHLSFNKLYSSVSRDTYFKAELTRAIENPTYVSQLLNGSFKNFTEQMTDLATHSGDDVEKYITETKNKFEALPEGLRSQEELEKASQEKTQSMEEQLAYVDVNDLPKDLTIKIYDSLQELQEEVEKQPDKKETVAEREKRYTEMLMPILTGGCILKDRLDLNNGVLNPQNEIGEAERILKEHEYDLGIGFGQLLLNEKMPIFRHIIHRAAENPEYLKSIATDNLGDLIFTVIPENLQQVKELENQRKMEESRKAKEQKDEAQKEKNGVQPAPETHEKLYNDMQLNYGKTPAFKAIEKDLLNLERFANWNGTVNFDTAKESYARVAAFFAVQQLADTEANRIWHHRDENANMQHPIKDVVDTQLEQFMKNIMESALFKQKINTIGPEVISHTVISGVKNFGTYYLQIIENQVNDFLPKTKADESKMEENVKEIKSEKRDSPAPQEESIQKGDEPKAGSASETHGKLYSELNQAYPKSFDKLFKKDLQVLEKFARGDNTIESASVKSSCANICAIIAMNKLVANEGTAPDYDTKKDLPHPVRDVAQTQMKIFLTNIKENLSFDGEIKELANSPESVTKLLNGSVTDIGKKVAEKLSPVISDLLPKSMTAENKITENVKENRTETHGKLYMEMNDRVNSGTFESVKKDFANLEEFAKGNKMDSDTVKLSCKRVYGLLTVLGLSSKENVIANKNGEKVQVTTKEQLNDLMKKVVKQDAFLKNIEKMSKDPKAIETLLGQSLTNASQEAFSTFAGVSKSAQKLVHDETGKNLGSNTEVKSEGKPENSKSNEEVIEDEVERE